MCLLHAAVLRPRCSAIQSGAYSPPLSPIVAFTVLQFVVIEHLLCGGGTALTPCVWSGWVSEFKANLTYGNSQGLQIGKPCVLKEVDDS